LSSAFVKFIEQIDLCGGGIDQGTNLAEALSVALTMLTYEDNILPENKHAVIISNSDFYSTPVQSFNNFYNKTIDQMIDAAFQESIRKLYMKIL
jgi:hypothetical protein